MAAAATGGAGGGTIAGACDGAAEPCVFFDAEGTAATDELLEAACGAELVATGGTGAEDIDEAEVAVTTL